MMTKALLCTPFGRENYLMFTSKTDVVLEGYHNLR